MKRIIFIILIFAFKICPIKGQILTFGGGATYFAQRSKALLHPDILGKRVGNDQYFLKVQYNHILNKKVFLSASYYSNYPVYTFFHFYKQNGGGGRGWSGTNVRRFDLSVMYNTFHKSNFIFMPSLGLGIQKSIPTGNGCICNDISEGIKPDNFELLDEIDAYAYDNTQLVAVAGVKLGYAFFGRLELFIDIQQVFGHKTIQELKMNYSYNGIVQPEAISSSDGTGRFWSLGIGFRFVKPK